MRSIPSVFSVVVLSALLTAASAAEAVFPYHCHKEVLPNGLTVLMIPMPSEGIVSYFSIVRAGSRNEVEPPVGLRPFL